MQNDVIKKTIEDILGKLTIPFDKIEIINNDETLIFMIRVKEAHFLIGSRGINIGALNHIIRKIIDKQNTNDEFTNFIVDINDYQTKRTEEIKNKVQITKERVKSFCTDIEMEPMSSYERMIVHSFLAEDEDIVTESTGFGRDRRVVIKFKK